MFRNVFLACVLCLITAGSALSWTQAISPGDAYDIRFDSNLDVWVAGETSGKFAWAKYRGSDGVVLQNCQSQACNPPVAYMNFPGRAYAIAFDNAGVPIIAGYEVAIGQNWYSQFTVVRGNFVYDVHENVAGGVNEANDIAVLPSPSTKVVIAGFTTVNAVPPHREIYLSVADASANEVAFRNLTGSYVLGDAEAEAVAALSDNTVVVVGKVWEAVNNDALYVHRVQTTSGMANAWSSPYTAGSPLTSDSAYDVAVAGNRIGVAGTRGGSFFVSVWDKDSFVPQGTFPYMPIAGAAYAVAMDSNASVVAAGETAGGDLYVDKRNQTNGAISGATWPKTVAGVQCRKSKCDVAVDSADNVIVVASKDSQIWTQRWDKNGTAIGAPVLSASGTTGRAVTSVGTAYAVASDGGMRATLSGCAIAGLGGEGSANGLIWLVPGALLLVTARRRRPSVSA
jgi:hypothetical protein